MGAIKGLRIAKLASAVSSIFFDATPISKDWPLPINTKVWKKTQNTSLQIKSRYLNLNISFCMYDLKEIIINHVIYLDIT